MKKNSALKKIFQIRLIFLGKDCRSGIEVGKGTGKGYSLIELIISLLVSTIITGMLFSFCIEVQKKSAEIASTIESRDSLRLVPVILSRWIKGAGMNINGAPELYLEIEEDQIGIRSDFKGDDGNPDGDTNDTFEDISLRVIGNELKVKSGSGSYQPFLKSINSLSVKKENRTLLKLRLTGVESSLNTSDSAVIETAFLLWNPRPNLFPKELQ